jgi:flagellar basal-body rod protein FlgG
MIRALFTSATGMNAQQTMIDNTSNNIANVNTNGYKKGQADFQDLIYINERPPGAEISAGQQAPTGLQIGSGVRVAGTSKIFSQGTLIKSDKPLDLAIEGDGFFQVTTPSNEVRYTRDGSFQLSSTGQIVTTDGYPLSPAITISPDAVTIFVGADGTVSVKNPDGTQTNAGQITLARFPNSAGLSAEGSNLFSRTDASGDAVVGTPGLNGTGTIRQRFLERSNVDIVIELTNLILAQRAYEFNTRSIRTADNMLSAAVDLVR